VEVKLSATIGPFHIKNFEKLRLLLKTSKSNYLICNTPEAMKRKNTFISLWLNLQFQSLLLKIGSSSVYLIQDSCYLSSHSLLRVREKAHDWIS
jgi:hypothetical protein